MNPCQCFTFGIAVPLHQPCELRYRIDVHQPRFVNVRIVFYLIKQGHVKKNDRIFFIFLDLFDFPVDTGMDEGKQNGFELRFLSTIAKDDTADVGPVHRSVS